jgi:hypothetical protein
MEKEEWKPVPDWPEYEVSNMGQVRRAMSGSNAKIGKILKPQPLGAGYQCVNLSGHGTRKKMLVHRLVAIAFLGESGTLEVCHWDGDPWNCRLDNLRYDTPQNNAKDKKRHGTLARGERNGSNKWKTETVLKIKQSLRSGKSWNTVSREFSIPVGTIGKIAKGRTWAWL